MRGSGVRISHVAGDRAFYNLANDQVVLPEQGQFATANGYYQTALHELGHASGHESRLNRKTLQDGIAAGFGSEAYAREELRAEISAMMTGQRVGVGHDGGRGAAYVENWLQVLQKEPREIYHAASEAQKISDYLTQTDARSSRRTGKEAGRAGAEVLPRSRAADQPHTQPPGESESTGIGTGRRPLVASPVRITDV